jgi:regulator of sigma E protease
MTILFAILLFSLLIFVHELGHFICAKLSGVQVNEFAMFMGPAIFKKQVGETLYSIRCIPLGGYCAMEGEDGDSDNPRSFQKAAWWKRLIILVAGAAMNFLCGILIFAIVYMPVKTIAEPVISNFTDCSVIDDAGLRAGDRILEIDGEKLYVHGDFSMLLAVNDAQTHDLVVLRNGEKLVLEDFPLVPHACVDEQGNEMYHYGLEFQVIEPTFGRKLAFVWENTMDTVRNVRLSLQMLFTGKASVSEMSGPVGIVDMMVDVASDSQSLWLAISNMLWFGGFIAVNLAIMNLLPIPALDGGRVVGLLLTTIVEAITRKKLNPKYEGYLHGAGMILLLALMAFILFKDIFMIFQR